MLPLLGAIALLVTGRYGRHLLLLLGGSVIAVGYFAQGYHILDARYMLTAGFPALAGLMFAGAATLVAFVFPAFLRALHRQRPELSAMPAPGAPTGQALPALMRAIDANLAHVPVFTTATAPGLTDRYQLDPVPIMEGSRLWRIRPRAQAGFATPTGQETPVPPMPQ